MTTSFFYRAASGILLLIGSILSGCKQVCDDNLPQYSLSAGVRAWAAPFAANASWRFRNPAGYERTYRVSNVQTEMESGGGGKSSFCPSYYREYLQADLQRTDSTLATPNYKPYYLHLKAPVVTSYYQDLHLNWQGYFFSLPLEAVEAGQHPLTTATFGGRTYPNVLELTNGQLGSRVLHLYLTKADGVVAFDDQYGTLWARP